MGIFGVDIPSYSGAKTAGALGTRQGVSRRYRTLATKGFNHPLDRGEGATFCAVAASLVGNLQIIAGE